MLGQEDTDRQSLIHPMISSRCQDDAEQKIGATSNSQQWRAWSQINKVSTTT